MTTLPTAHVSRRRNGATACTDRQDGGLATSRDSTYATRPPTSAVHQDRDGHGVASQFPDGSQPAGPTLSSSGGPRRQSPHPRGRRARPGRSGTAPGLFLIDPRPAVHTRHPKAARRAPRRPRRCRAASASSPAPTPAGRGSTSAHQRPMSVRPAPGDAARVLRWRALAEAMQCRQGDGQRTATARPGREDLQPSSRAIVDVDGLAEPQLGRIACRPTAGTSSPSRNTPNGLPASPSGPTKTRTTLRRAKACPRVHKPVQDPQRPVINRPATRDHVARGTTYQRTVACRRVRITSSHMRTGCAPRPSTGGRA